MSKAGGWELKVTGPYPIWGELIYDDQTIRGIRHDELRDLEYVVKRAIQEAREMLPEGDRHEMD